MTEREHQRLVNHRLAVIRHAEEVTGNVAQTCRYYGITRQTFYRSRRDLAEVDTAVSGRRLGGKVGTRVGGANVTRPGGRQPPPW